MRAVALLLLGIAIGLFFVLLWLVLAFLFSMVFAPSAQAARPSAFERIPDSEFAPVPSSWPGPTEQVTPVRVLPAPKRATESAIEPALRLSSPDPSTGTVSGVVSWYPVAGLVAATHSWHWAQTPFDVKVCTKVACVTVLVQDYCEACVNGRLLDLSAGAFRVLAPLSAGLVQVEATGWR